MWRYCGLIFILALVWSTSASAKYPVPRGVKSVKGFPSPNGKWVILQGDYGMEWSHAVPPTDLWIMRAGTKKIRRFTQNKLSYDPVWSKDSRQFAYVSRWSMWISNSRATRRKLVAKGEDPTKVHNSIAYDSAKWSPDSRFLAFEGSAGTGWVMVYCVRSRITAFQSDMETSSPIWLKNGDFSFEDPDGKRVVRAGVLKLICARKHRVGHPTHEVFNTADAKEPGLALRSTPSAGKSVRTIKRLIDGTRLSLLKARLGHKKKWLKVRVESGTHSGRTGYVHGEWVRVLQEKASK